MMWRSLLILLLWVSIAFGQTNPYVLGVAGSAAAATEFPSGIALNGSGDYLIIDPWAAITTTPFTICMWFYNDSASANDALYFIGDKDTGDSFYSTQLQGGAAGDPLRIFNNASVIVDTLSGLSGGTGTWHLSCTAEGSGDTDHHVYLDGGNAGDETDTTTTPAQTPDTFCIGRLCDKTPLNDFTGSVAHLGLWSIKLSAAEIASLYIGAEEGYRMDCVQSGSLARYWRLIDETDLTDLQANDTLSAQGTPSTGPGGLTIQPCP